MMLAFAHYGDFISIKDMAAGLPKEDAEGNPISEDDCKAAVVGYDSAVANLVSIDKWYKDYPLSASPLEEGQSSAPPADTAEDEAAKDLDTEAPENADADPPAM